MRRALTGLLLIVVLAAAGCGGNSTSNNSASNGEASKAAEQVLADAVKAAKGASSLHMSGHIDTRGEQIGVDIEIVNGEGATGSVTLKGEKVDLVVTGGEAYMKAGADFWKKFAGSSGETVALLVADKWIKFPTNDARFEQFTVFTNSDSLFATMNANHRKLKNNGAMTYQGQSAVAIVDTGADGGTLYVAATGTPFPVGIVKKGTNDAGSISFDSWNKSVTLTAPADAIDASALGG